MSRLFVVLIALSCACAVTSPSTPREAFRAIGSEYVHSQHDCDDMAQEFADWLAASGVSREGMRFASATHNYYEEAPPHFWLEVRTDGSWLIYDPAGGDYAVPIEGSDLYANYVMHYISSSRVYLDAPIDRGYRRHGDRWVAGRWIRSER